jgi:RND family efflux transporter MFP subunit
VNIGIRQSIKIKTKQMKKYLHTILIVSVTIFITSCSSDKQKVVVNNSPAIKVTINKVALNTNSQFLSVSGKINASNSADLSTRMMGFVTKANVNVGDKVTKGQLLITINNKDLQAKKGQINAGITQAKTAFNNAEKNYNRFKNLFESNSITLKEMDDMTANYQIAKAGLESANHMKNEINAQFEYANITAPFSGVITGKNIEVGDMANPGISLISIENPSDFEVIAMVPESEIMQIKNDIEVKVLVKSINKSIKGKVIEVSSSAKNTGGQYLVKISLEKTDVTILSGMFTTVQFPVDKKSSSESILIPVDAIVKKGQLSGVYVISGNNTAMLRWLRLGRTYGDQVEILSGLNADESYIISSDGKLFNGEKVRYQ